jgi:hypothetical protein
MSKDKNNAKKKYGRSPAQTKGDDPESTCHP